MREKRTQCYEREEDTVLRERRGHSVTREKRTQCYEREEDTVLHILHLLVRTHGAQSGRWLIFQSGDLHCDIESTGIGRHFVTGPYRIHFSLRKNNSRAVTLTSPSFFPTCWLG